MTAQHYRVNSVLFSASPQRFLRPLAIPQVQPGGFIASLACYPDLRCDARKNIASVARVKFWNAVNF